MSDEIKNNQEEEEENNEDVAREGTEDEEERDDIEDIQEEEYAGREPKEKVKQLKEKLASSEKEKSEYLDNLQRARADLVNLRTKYEKKEGEAREDARREVIQDILPALDSFSMALSEKKWEELPEEWRKGMEHVHTQLLKALEKYDVAPFSPENEQFDPAFHEALGTVAVSDPEKDNSVLEVIQKGSAQNDTVIRTAKVKVGQYEEERSEPQE